MYLLRRDIEYARSGLVLIMEYIMVPIMLAYGMFSILRASDSDDGH